MVKNMIGRGAAIVSTLGTLTVLGFVLAGPASAADPVTTAFADMESKITLYGGAIVALVVLSAALFLGIKYLRKGVSKA